MLSRRKKTLFYLIYLLFLLALLVPSAEILARVTGHKPWIVKINNIKVEPGGRLFEKDPMLGYRHLPGQFKITLGGSYVFFITNLNDTLRATHPLDTYGAPDAKPGIWIFGDSVTYGWSVNDQDTFSWLLQEDFRDYEIVNFAVSGYGTLHSLIQLREALRHRKPPRLVFLIYASWLDERNTINRKRSKMFASFLGPVNQPYAILTDNGKLDISQEPLENRNFPLVRYSAFINMIDDIYNDYDERRADSHQVSKAIIKEMAGLCRAHGAELIVTCLTHDPETTDMFEYCHGEGLKTVDMGVDLTIKENTNLPFDVHPSAIAHRQYEQMLKSYLLSRLPEARKE